MMTTLNGTYLDCGYGKDFSIVMDCMGPSCDGLLTFPILQCQNSTSPTVMHCTNGVTCPGPTNHSSIFSLIQPIQNLSLVQNLTVGNRLFLVTDDGRGNASYSNGTAPISNGTTATSGTRSGRTSLAKTFLFIVVIMNLLVGPVVCTLCIPGISDLINKLPPYFQVANYLEGKVSDICQSSGNALAVAVLVGEKEFDLAVADLTVDCMEILSVGEIPALANPPIAVALEIANLLICSKLSEAILFGAVERGVSFGCDQVASAVGNIGCTQSTTSFSTTSTTSSTSSNTVSTTTSSSSSTASISSTGAGPPLPVGTALAADQCVSCQLSLYYLGVQGLATQCGVTQPVFLAADLSVTFCDPSIQPRYSQLCTDLCANPCSTYDIQTWRQAVGAGFMAGASIPVCNQLCPGFAGTGRCVGILPCSICAKGAGTCVPC